MRACGLILLLATFLTCSYCKEETKGNGDSSLAIFPPRGWNSYDAFSWVIDEETFLKNAEFVASKLSSFGYEYVVVDFLWYRKNVEGAPFDSFGYDNIDGWGRPYPDPERWPSSKGGGGFAEVARKVHDLGLKFGIHVMRGISTQAVNRNTPILNVNTGTAYMDSGRKWSAEDIGIKERTCTWLKNGFMSVNTDGAAGKAFLRSLYQQYAEWGVDFVKLDCIFGQDLELKEIITVSELLQEFDRPMVFSISPGASATPSMADEISDYVNMYRITGDDWDNWGDVAAHFDVSRDFSAHNKIGAKGLRGRSWPDLDMLPFGWLTYANAAKGPHRSSNLTLDEQKTQITLWSMAKSPIMFGGDLTHIDDTTFELITNPVLLEINSYSTKNTEFPYVNTRVNIGRHNLKLRKLLGDENLNTLDTNLLGLTRCDSENAKGWFSAKSYGLDHICWRGNLKGFSHQPYCLTKKEAFLTWDKEITEQEYATKYRLSTYGTSACLEASQNKKHSASETDITSFTKCKQHAAQMWELKDNGTLVNSYANLCLRMHTNKASYFAANEGTRSWIAVGRLGEIYLSFFNLNSQTSVMSAGISDILKFLQLPNKGPCICGEVWSKKFFGTEKDSVSMEVPKHGCALFILICY